MQLHLARVLGHDTDGKGSDARSLRQVLLWFLTDNQTLLLIKFMTHWMEASNRCNQMSSLSPRITPPLIKSQSIMVKTRAPSSRHRKGRVADALEFDEKLCDGPTVLISHQNVIAKMVCPSLTIIRKFSIQLIETIEEAQVSVL